MDTHQGVYNVILCSSDGSIQKILGFGFELENELKFGFDLKLNPNFWLWLFFKKEMFSFSIFHVETFVLEKKHIIPLKGQI